MRNRYLLGAGVALAVTFGGVQAHAQWGPYPGAFYIGPEGGWTSLSNQNDTVKNLGGTPLGNRQGQNYNSGYNVGARGGYQWGPWRFEEEYSYRDNGLSSVSGPLNGSTSQFSGSRRTHSIMTNVIYDFTIGWPVTPHIGFGVGAVDMIDSVTARPFTLGRLVGTTPAGPFVIPAQTYGGTLLNGSTWGFGYQAIAGLRYDINPLLAVDLDYRYLATTNQTINNKGTFPLPNGTAGTNLFQGTKYTTGYNTQNLVASLTMKFGPPPPAPPPPAPAAAPPPPPHQVYLVFFDWDKYNITQEGMQIITVAANQYKAGGSVRLQVTGYTDLSGSAGYNQRLSERRANAVANALASKGVARSDMVVTGRGMNDPRVPTAPGVREPQNRRVEIVFP